MGTIARQLGPIVARFSVSKTSGIRGSRQNKTLDIGFLPFIQAQLERYPQLTASRIYQMSKSAVSVLPITFGPSSAGTDQTLAEAYLRLRTLPGEQGQVD